MRRAEGRRRTGRVLGAAALALALGCFGVAVSGGAGAAEVPSTAAPSPTTGPSGEPTTSPSADPTASPSADPTDEPTGEPTPSPSTSPTEDPDTGVREVSGAVLRWGVSNQSNARSHNPLSINFLAAGVANPGGGGRQLRQDQWRAAQGDVEIQKRRPDGSFVRATWRGLSTTPDGRRIGMERDFSDHHVVIRGGTGTVDPGAGDAEVSWRGTFTVVYYGGNTVFTVSNPRLVVEDGVGRLTATMGGFYADRNDTSLWKRAPQRTATIADLPSVDVGALGTTVQPAYDGVETSGGSEPQRREDAGWGSFPQSFVSYLVPLNTDQFWYSTGLSTDHTKRPLPITFSWTAREVEPPAPEPTTAPSPTPTNPVVTPPPAAPAPGGDLPASGTSGLGTGTSSGVGALPRTSVPAGQVGTGGTATGTLPGATRLVAAPRSAPSVTPLAESPWWWVGGVLLLLAAALLLLPGGLVPSAARRP